MPWALLPLPLLRYAPLRLRMSRYRDSVTSEAEQFEIPPLFQHGASPLGGVAGSLVRRLSEMAVGTRRGSEAMNGETI